MKKSRKHTGGEQRRKIREVIRALPETPGVYLFYGQSSDLLYIGKSRTLRTRVRSHFSAHEEAAMCSKVSHILVRETAGELGALLLESQLIKELRPAYNKASRHKRRIIIARRMTTTRGYISVVLEAISQIDPAMAGSILAIFKTRSRAANYLAEIAKRDRLCPKLLGLEQTKRFCFAYHLRQCGGACMGEEDPGSYNKRLERAFEDRRVKAWPFHGAVIIEERREDASEVFVVDNWCLLYSISHSSKPQSLTVRGLHRFDYDSYRILAGYVFDEANSPRVRPASKEEIESLIRQTRAA